MAKLSVYSQLNVKSWYRSSQQQRTLSFENFEEEVTAIKWEASDQSLKAQVGKKKKSKNKQYIEWASWQILSQP